MPGSAQRTSIVHDISPSWHIDPPGSHYWAGSIFLGLTLLLVLALRDLLRSRRALRQAVSARVDEAAPAPGARIIKGVVRPVPNDRGCPIRVEITQQGQNVNTGKQARHCWTEVDRTVSASPFYLELAGGESVRVEPGDSPYLIDRLEERARPDRDRRTLVAELSAGETVIVAGTLERAFDPEGKNVGASYRDAGVGWIMRPSAGRLLLSTESLDKRYRSRWASDAVAVGLTLWTILIALVAYHPYLARGLLGTTVEARVEKRELGRKKRKGRTVVTRTIRYRVPRTLAADSPRTGSLEVNEETYRSLRVGSRIYVRVVTGLLASATAAGRGGSSHFFSIAFGLFALIGAVVYRFVLRRPAAWYDAPLVDWGEGAL